MILIAAEKIEDLTDSILWAGLEFCMQCVAYESGIRNRYQIKIVDMSELNQISGPELYILGHGSADLIQVEGPPPRDCDWDKFGEELKPYIPDTIRVIHVLSCFAADGPSGNTGLHKLARGIGKGGITYYGYIGPVVGNIVTGPAHVINTVSNTIDDIVDAQDAIVARMRPDLMLKAWRMANPSANRVDTAAAAAEKTWEFFESFTSVFKTQGYFYGPTTEGAKRVELRT